MNELNVGAIDLLYRAEVNLVFKQSFDQLESGGIVSMKALDFQWFVQNYIESRVPTEETDKLLAGGRKSFWTEAAVAKALLTIGYFKVWTGRVADQPLWEFTAKAIKK